MKTRIEHDPDCPLGENGLRAYAEARDALASTPPEARIRQEDLEALCMAEFELEQTLVCNCGATAARGAGMKTMHVLSIDDEEMTMIKTMLRTTAESVRVSQKTLETEVNPGNFSPRETILLQMTTTHLEHMAGLLQALMLMMDKAESYSLVIQ